MSFPLSPSVMCPFSSPDIKVPKVEPPTNPVMSVLVLLKVPIPVPETVNVSPSNVRFDSPLRVKLPFAVNTLLSASLLIVIVPAVKDANEADTEVKSVRVKSTNVGLSPTCNPKSALGAATPLVVS